jgi:hypothetical protein
MRSVSRSLLAAVAAALAPAHFANQDLADVWLDQ